MESTKTVTKELRIQGLQLAQDYKYVNARGGQVGMSILHGEQTESAYVVLHFARVQFQPATGADGLDTLPVNSALASVELSLENAKTLRSLLDKLITNGDEES